MFGISGREMTVMHATRASQRPTPQTGDNQWFMCHNRKGPCVFFGELSLLLDGCYVPQLCLPTLGISGLWEMTTVMQQGLRLTPHVKGEIPFYNRGGNKPLDPTTLVINVRYNPSCRVGECKYILTGSSSSAQVCRIQSALWQLQSDNWMDLE